MKKLPHESRVMAMAQGGMEYWGWTVDRHFRAATIDTLEKFIYAFSMANTPKGKKKPDKPKPMPRPGDAQRKREENKNNPFSMIVHAHMNKLRNKEQKQVVVIPDE